ncbi:MAG: hypothetical protein M5U09_05195 [Gammaproteobacteria bacterium]|nr:hypothetical protein [Gammaproteobacteria bacterium]
MRLYTNGVLHSQYSPSPRAATSIWDLLAMPALLAGGGRPDRVLVLGVGGGGALRTIDRRFGAPMSQASNSTRCISPRRGAISACRRQTSIS